MKSTETVFTLIVIPSTVLMMKLYFPGDGIRLAKASSGVLNSVQVSIFTLTSSKFWENSMKIELVIEENIWENVKFSLTHIIGSLFNLVQGMWNFTLLHSALVIFIQAGNSSKSVKAISSSSKAVTSPSPLIVLKLILSVDKFLKYLKVYSDKSWLKEHTKHSKEK